MRRFRCDGSQFVDANNLPKGLGSRIETCCSLFILDPRIFFVFLLDNVCSCWFYVIVGVRVHVSGPCGRSG